MFSHSPQPQIRLICSNSEAINLESILDSVVGTKVERKRGVFEMEGYRPGTLWPLRGRSEAHWRRDEDPVVNWVCIVVEAEAHRGSVKTACIFFFSLHRVVILRNFG